MYLELKRSKAGATGSAWLAHSVPTALGTVPGWRAFQKRKPRLPGGSVTCSRTHSQCEWQGDSGGRVYGEELRRSHSHIYAGESSIYAFPKYRNSEGASLTSLAHVDNLKPNIFTLSITVGPDHQGLALPSLSFQSFLKSVGKSSESTARGGTTLHLSTKQT